MVHPSFEAHALGLSFVIQLLAVSERILFIESSRFVY